MMQLHLIQSDCRVPPTWPTAVPVLWTKSAPLADCGNQCWRLCVAMLGADYPATGTPCYLRLQRELAHSPSGPINHWTWRLLESAPRFSYSKAKWNFAQWWLSGAGSSAGKWVKVRRTTTCRIHETPKISRNWSSWAKLCKTLFSFTADSLYEKDKVIALSVRSRKHLGEIHLIFIKLCPCVLLIT